VLDFMGVSLETQGAGDNRPAINAGFLAGNNGSDARDGTSRSNGFLSLTTSDEDFVAMSVLRGPPPRVHCGGLSLEKVHVPQHLTGWPRRSSSGRGCPMRRRATLA
jgi:hypothetical protein